MEAILSRVMSSIMGKLVKGDDFVDRLHHLYSSMGLLGLGATLIGVKYLMPPINCWLPENLEGDSYADTIDAFCWEASLYRHEEAEKPTDPWLIDFGTAFFKWVPFIFIIQGLTFKLPNALWKMGSGSTPSDLTKLRDLVEQSRTAKDERKQKHKMNEVVHYFETWVTGYSDYNNGCLGKHTSKILPVFFCLGKHSGSYLSSLYLCIKLLNLINLAFNILILECTFSTKFWRYGFDVVSEILQDGDFEDDAQFPKTLMCDFEVHSETSTLYIVSCEMSINNLLQKVFVVLWFWLAILLLLTAANGVIWLFRIKQPCSTFFFIQDYIQKVEASEDKASMGTALEVQAEQNREKQEDFAEDYLRSDGIFLLRMLELNADRSIVVDLVTHLWERHSKIGQFRASILDMDPNDRRISVYSTTFGYGNSRRPSQNTRGTDNFGYVSEDAPSSNFLSVPNILGPSSSKANEHSGGGLFGSVLGGSGDGRKGKSDGGLGLSGMLSSAPGMLSMDGKGSKSSGGNGPAGFLNGIGDKARKEATGLGDQLGSMPSSGGGGSGLKEGLTKLSGNFSDDALVDKLNGPEKKSYRLSGHGAEDSKDGENSRDSAGLGSAVDKVREHTGLANSPSVTDHVGNETSVPDLQTPQAPDGGKGEEAVSDSSQVKNSGESASSDTDNLVEKTQL